MSEATVAEAAIAEVAAAEARSGLYNSISPVVGGQVTCAMQQQVDAVKKASSD